MKYEYKTLSFIRHQVFTAVSKMAFEDNLDNISNIPFEIVPGDINSYRGSVFLDRAIVSERIRLAMGLNLRDSDKPRSISQGIENAKIPSKYYEPPLINIIKFACNACPDNKYEVTDMCRGCLAHPCVEVCPKDAVSIIRNKSYIDQDKCIKCGLCAKNCPYNAIIHHERPCAQACGMDAISSDEHGRADIDYELCVSCGMCLVNCPFGAISDKSQIYQLIQSINAKEEVIAIVAPSYLGQFGRNVGFEDFKKSLKEVGFSDVVEVAIGADICTIEEAEDFLENVPKNLKFMGTSCCPSWSMMGKKLFPEFTQNISMSLTPMVFTARFVRETHKHAKIVFVGPCSAKKLEASRRTVKSEVDFVITYEELSGMFDAKEVKVIGTDNSVNDEATAAGRGFAVGGGVAGAVASLIAKEHPEMDPIPIKSAAGLKECRDMMKDAKRGKYDGYLLEGMGCPGGCVAGAGCIVKSNTAGAQVKKAVKQSNLKDSNESQYSDKVYLLKNFDKK
jgi:[FeFe] hydrogenase (group B1/B3)